MRFKENDVVELKNPEAKYFGVNFKVHVEEDLEYENLLKLEDPNGRLITVSEDAVKLSVLTFPHLAYKGYTSVAKFDEESNCFHGHLLGIPDLVTWEADSEEDCEIEFRNAVDDFEDMLKFVNESSFEE